jgi:hypothetical protein
MSIRERLEALHAKHHSLDAMLEDEVHRPLPNSEQVSRIKREKLRLKDEIARIEASAALAVN